jgi:hypothetical protein
MGGVADMILSRGDCQILTPYTLIRTAESTAESNWELEGFQVRGEVPLAVSLRG